MKVFDGNINKIISSTFTKVMRIIPDWVTPNSISFVGGFLSVGTILLFGFCYSDLELVVLLLFLIFPFDVLDGMLARYRGLETEFGRKLDPAIDNTVAILFIIYLLYSEVLSVLSLVLIGLYACKYTLVLLKRSYDVGGGRMALVGMFFIKIVADLWWIQYNTILIALIIWNCISLFSGIYLTREVKTITVD